MKDGLNRYHNYILIIYM